MPDSKPPTKRLGTLDSQRAKTGDAVRLGSLKDDEAGPSGSGSRLAAKFRPKNFAKPDNTPPPEPTPAPQAKALSVQDAASRRNRRNTPNNKYSNVAQEVVFGGGVGAGAQVQVAPGNAPGNGASARGDSQAGASTSGAVKESGSGVASKGKAPATGPKTITKAIDIKDEDEDDSKSEIDDSVTSDSEEESGNEDDPMGPTPLVPRGVVALPPVPPELLSRGAEDFTGLMAELSSLGESTGDGLEALMLMQLPSVLPIPVPPSNGAGGPLGENFDNKNVVGAAAAAIPSAIEGRPAALSELPAMHLGKLLVFKSGKVKLKVGDVLFDVAPGIQCRMRQELAIVDPVKKDCTVLGAVRQRVVVTPDLDTLLSDEPLPQWKKAEAGTTSAGTGAGGAQNSNSRRRRQVIIESDGESEDLALREKKGGTDAEMKDEMEIDDIPLTVPAGVSAGTKAASKAGPSSTRKR